MAKMTSYWKMQQGKTPSGEAVPIPVGGQAVTPTVETLKANEEYSTGWIPISGYGSVLYVIRADKPSAPSGISVEFSDDGEKPILAGASVTYNQVGQQIQRVLVPKGKFIRIRFKNGSEPQKEFRLEVKLSTTLVQPTEGSLNLPLSDTALAMYTKTDIEANDGTGTYGQIYRTGNALNVHIINPTDTTDDEADDPVYIISARPAHAANQYTYNVTTTPILVLPANLDRKGVLVYNAGNVNASLYFGNQFKARVGRLKFGEEWTMPFPVFGGEIYAKSDSATTTLEITELH